jgi:hypothetical protein
VLAALGASAVAVVQLLHLNFSSGVVALNLSTWDLVFDGVTYKGAYGLGAISAVTDKPGEVQGITLELAGGPADRITLALDAADVVQGTVCTIRTAIIETTGYTVLDAPIEWLGTLDTMSIAEDGQSASIRITAESRAVALLRGTPSFYAEADQTAISATDHSMQYVVDQVDKPVIWPAKAFFYQ